MSVMLLFSLFKCKDEPGPIGEDSLVPPIVETKKTVNTTKVVTYEDRALESSGLAKVWVNDTELLSTKQTSTTDGSSLSVNRISKSTRCHL